MKTLVRTEARYPVGMSVLYWNKRAHIISAKWSEQSGWWYEIRFPNSLAHSIPERLVVPTED